MRRAYLIPYAAVEKINVRSLFPSLIAGLLFSEILLYGANATDLALGFAGAWFLILAILQAQGWAREGLTVARFRWIGFAFAAMIVNGVYQLAPYAPEGPHPVWTWVPGANHHGTIDPYLTVVEIIKLAALGAVFLTGAVMGADSDRARSLIEWILRLGLIYSLWSFYDHFTNPNELFGAPRPFDPSRLSASLASANTAGTLFGCLTLLNLAALGDRFLRQHRRYGRLTAASVEKLIPVIFQPLVAMAAAATCLILTLSRGAIAATIAVGTFMLGGAIMTRARRGAITAPASATVAILAGLMIASFAINLGSIAERTGGLQADRFVRSAIYSAHWAAFIAAPITGYGLGSFIHINAMLMDQKNQASLDMLGAVHNVYLQWLEQAGVIGTGALLICAATIIVILTRGTLKQPSRKVLISGCLATLFVVILHGFTDFASEVPAIITFSVLIQGVGVGLSLRNTK